MAYSDKVLDHYSNPRNVGSMDKNSTEVGTGLVGAPECGDVMKLQIKVNPQTNIIEDAKFKTFGCGSAIASSSLATEWVKGKTVEEALQIKNTEIVKELALPPVKIHCSVLAEDAIRAAIHDWKAKQGAAKPAAVGSRSKLVGRQLSVRAARIGIIMATITEETTKPSPGQGRGARSRTRRWRRCVRPSSRKAFRPSRAGCAWACRAAGVRG